jgi:outer membrane lipoprotein-sorting protein
MTSLLLTLFLSISPLHAETVDEIVDAAREAQKIDSSIQSLRMTLISRSGAERVREFEVRVRKDGEVIKSYTRFSHPADVAGTQLVMVDHPDSADQQMLYLPAFKQLKKISGKARSGSFMGSDFAFEDLEVSGVSSSSPSLISEDAAAWVIDTHPGGDSSYSRVRLHVSKSDYLPRRVEFFDKHGEALKILEVLETETQGDLVMPTQSRMTHLQRGSSTLLEVVSHELNVPAERIPDDTFTPTYMERNGQ